VLGVCNYFQPGARTGAAATRAIAGHLALAWAVILAILNLRLDKWEASLHGMDLAAMHRLLPVWTIPLLTLALLIWVGVMLVLTKPERHL
jgi:hypothetical protein